MADANLEMIAIAVALGIPQKEFQRILMNNGTKLADAYADNNPFVELVANHIRLKGRMDAPASQVWGEILTAIPGSTKNFPDSASAFSRRLNEEKDSLEQAGIRFSRYKKNDANYIRLERIPKSLQTKAQKDVERRKSLLLDDASTEN